MENEEFKDLVNRLAGDDERFWLWVREWLDKELVIEMAENWTDEVKKDELEHLREMIESENCINCGRVLIYYTLDGEEKNYYCDSCD